MKTSINLPESLISEIQSWNKENPGKDDHGNYGTFHDPDVEWVRGLLADIEEAHTRYGKRIVFGEHGLVIIPEKQHQTPHFVRSLIP
ncbi:MAG: hypothetical protein V1854_01005 [Methanobacteriota archaeon]